MASPPAEVLIVGAGPTGLVMACALARSGISFRLVETALRLPDDGTSLILQPRTLEILGQLGIDPTPLGRKIERVRFFVDGVESLSLDFAPLVSEGTSFPYQLNLPRRALIDLLLTKLHDGGCAQIVPKGHYLGAAEDERYVVGCEGTETGSWVRGVEGIALRESGPAQTIQRTEVTLADPAPAEQLMGLSRDGVCALFPLEGHKALLMGAGATDLAALVRSCLPSVRIAEAKPLPPRHVRHGLAERYSNGRAFLCGTTAHIQSPMAGQEENAGIQDAWNLAWKLSFVLKAKATPKLLESYEAERRPVGQFFAASTDRLFEQAAQPGAAQSLMRKVVAPALARGVRGRADLLRLVAVALTNLGIQYQQSPWVGGVRTQAPLPGDRAPDCSIGSGPPTRLFDLLGERFILLLPTAAPRSAPLEEKAARLAQEVQSRWPEVLAMPLFHDTPDGPGTQAHRLLGATGPTALLVRPDGHLGWRATGWDTEGLTQHLRCMTGSHESEFSTIHLTRA